MADEENGLVSIDDTVDDSATQRRFTRDEYIKVITYAFTLQEFDKREGNERLRASITESLPLDEEVSLPTFFRAGRDLSISKKYVERALAIMHPSVEEQLADIRNVRAIPTIDVIGKTYEHNLLHALRSAVPTDKFEIIYCQDPKSYYNTYDPRSPSPSFFRVTETEEKRKFLLWDRKSLMKEEYRRLATFKFDPFDSYDNDPKGQFSLKIALLSELFLRACGETLAKLNEEFKSQMAVYDIKHHYRVK